MSFMPPSIMAAGAGAVISPDGTDRIPPELWADYAAIVLLDPEPALLADWIRNIEDGLGVRDFHRVWVSEGWDAARTALRSADPQGAGEIASSWYAVQTAPRQERKAAYALSQKGLAVFVPMETDWGQVRGKIDKTSYAYAPLLPGYFFVMIDEAGFRAVLEIEGVVGFVDFIDGRGECRPFPIPPAAIIEMQADERAGRYDLTMGKPPKPAKAQYRPKKGERVQVIAGPYLTYIGRVLTAPKKSRVKVEFDDGRTPMLKVSHVAAAA